MLLIQSQHHASFNIYNDFYNMVKINGENNDQSSRFTLMSDDKPEFNIPVLND